MTHPSAGRAAWQHSTGPPPGQMPITWRVPPAVPRASRRRQLDLLPAAVPVGGKLIRFPAAAVYGTVFGNPVVASFLELLLQRHVGDPMSLIARPVGPYRVIERRQERLLCFPA